MRYQRLSVILLSALAALIAFGYGADAQATPQKAPKIVEGAFGWDLSNAKIVQEGKTRNIKQGTITSNYIVEATATATTGMTPIKKGAFRMTIDSFSPAYDMPGQKAGVWYVRGKWVILDDQAAKEAKKARYSPAVIRGSLSAELDFDPAAAGAAINTVNAMVVIMPSPAAGRWTVAKGTFMGNRMFQGSIAMDAAVWPDVAKVKGVAK